MFNADAIIHLYDNIAKLIDVEVCPIIGHLQMINYATTIRQIDTLIIKMHQHIE